MTRTIDEHGNLSGRVVGPAIRRPLDPEQDARNAEMVLRVVDPASGREINILKCIHSSFYTEPHRGMEYRGFVITKNQGLLQRLRSTDETFSWSVDSTFGFKGTFAGKLETEPDFAAQEVTIRVLLPAPGQSR